MAKVKRVSDHPHSNVKSAGKLGQKFWLNNNKVLLILWEIEGCIHKLQSKQGYSLYYTVIDDGATQCLEGISSW